MIRLHDTIARNAWRDPGGDACVDPASGRRLTHGRLADRAGRLATAMVRRLGMAPGERIEVHLRSQVMSRMRWKKQRALTATVTLRETLSETATLPVKS